MDKPIKIILVDDDKDDCFLFKEALDELTLPVVLSIIHDGAEFMNTLKNDTVDFPDVIFLDLNMPRKNGFECLKEIKGHSTLKHLPVIIFSTSFDTHVANRLYEKGANYYMRKPSDFSTLKQLIEQALSHISSPPVLQPTQENFVLTI